MYFIDLVPGANAMPPPPLYMLPILICAVLARSKLKRHMDFAMTEDVVVDAKA